MIKVEQFYNKNQFLIKGGEKETDSLYFQSYDSTIAIIENNNLYLGSDWDYSKTTLKHLYLFLKDYKYKLNFKLYKLFCYDFDISKNKKRYIQNLINKNIIKVSTAL